MAEVASRKLPFGLNEYIRLFTDGVQPNAGKERIALNYYKNINGSNKDAVAQFAQLEGDPNKIDTAVEWLYASYYHVAARDVRPPEANAILPVDNPREVDLQFSFIEFQDSQILRFLGNSAAVGRHEGILKFITDRGNVTRADIEAYYRQNIAAYVGSLVDEQVAILERDISASMLTEIKRVITDFMLAPSHATYDVLRIAYRRYAGDGTIVLGRTMEGISPVIREALLNNKILGAK